MRYINQVFYQSIKVNAQLVGRVFNGRQVAEIEVD